MLDDIKRTNCMKLWFTDREFHDLCRSAIENDRKPGEMGRVIIRRSMYGTVASTDSEVHGANSPDTGPGALGDR